jgi:N-acetylglucosamine malate deacetylase 1
VVRNVETQDGMNVLVLAPHTDDEALGCGGTIAKHVEAGDVVHTMTFSSCGREDLKEEAKAASAILGSTLALLDFPVRRFSEHRQDILEAMVSERERFKPDRVYLPCSTDIHQDHRVIHEEGFRAFKHTTVLGYELPWNCPSFYTHHFSQLPRHYVEAKVAAIHAYVSQSHRVYTNRSAVYSQAEVRGMQCGRILAEAFEVIRWIS